MVYHLVLIRVGNGEAVQTVKFLKQFLKAHRCFFATVMRSVFQKEQRAVYVSV